MYFWTAGRSEQNLKRWYSRRGVGVQGFEQFLVDDGPHIEGQQLANLGHFAFVEEVVDATKRLPCRRCVNRPKYHVSGLSSANGCFKCFFVTHFAYEHDIWIFSYQCAKCFVEVEAVNAHFSLIDRRLGLGEDVFDRIFDRHDVASFAFVHVLQHGRDRCALSAAGDASKQDESVGCERDIAQQVGDVQVIKAFDFRRDQSASVGDLASTHEDIHAEAMVVVVVVCDVHLPVRGEDVVLKAVKDVLGNLVTLVMGHKVSIEGPQVATDADSRWPICLDVEIRGLICDAGLEVFAKLLGAGPRFSSLGMMDEPLLGRAM